MPKIKITSVNHTQQNNAINKARGWGAAARDGDYGPVKGKTAVVINTTLGAGVPAIQLSRADYSPAQNPYTQVFSYKEFMNLTVCPWDTNANATTAIPEDVGVKAQPVQTKVVIETVVVPVPVKVGMCAQDTLKTTSVDVLTQEKIGWTTLGLPSLKDAGVDIITLDGVAYILKPKKNTADKLTAKSAAKRARKDILAGKDTPFTQYARTFDLVANAVMTKVVDGDDD